MINLKKIDGTPIDVSVSPKFVAHYNKVNSWARYIIDHEINNGVWHDDPLDEVPKDGVIVDLGMNVGMFTIYMSQPDRKFYCVEPSESHISVAKELFEKLNIKAEVYEGVIYNISGSVRLHEEAENTTANRVASEGWRVNSLTLNDFLKRFNIEKVDLLKIDVEGAEQKIINEDPTVFLALQKCDLVFVETHDGMYEVKVDVPAIIAKMESLGFSYIKGKKGGSHYFKKKAA